MIMAVLVIMAMLVMIVGMVAFGMVMRVAVLMTIMVMMRVVARVMTILMGVAVRLECRVARLFGLRRINGICINDAALHPLATAATTRIAMP